LLQPNSPFPQAVKGILRLGKWKKKIGPANKNKAGCIVIRDYGGTSFRDDGGTSSWLRQFDGLMDLFAQLDDVEKDSATHDMLFSRANPVSHALFLS
jgi:hypothetical protein